MGDAHARSRVARARSRPWGYRVIDIAGNSIFEVQVRYCREDPWENLRRLAAALPRTPIRAGTRSNGIVTFHVTPDSVMDLWVERLAANGIRSFWMYDGLFNVDKIGRLAKVAKRAGCEVVPTMLYSSSPYHTDAYYADRARELAALEVDAIEIEDASGVLARDRTRGLRRAVKQAMGDRAGDRRAAEAIRRMGLGRRADPSALGSEKDIEAMRAAGPPAREYTIGGGNGELRLIEKLIGEGRGGYVHFESEQLSITLSREST